MLGHLDTMRSKDVRWKEGKAFTLTYFAGDDVHDLAEHVYGQWMTDNALNTDAFPSLRKIQADVVDIVNDWLEGGPDGAGFMTTGGTESILMAVKAARERGKAERGITQPNVVLPTSAPRSRRAVTTSGWRAAACQSGPIGRPTLPRWKQRLTTTRC
jgi:sphinganine-1-phosphate aldolase